MIFFATVVSFFVMLLFSIVVNNTGDKEKFLSNNQTDLIRMMMAVLIVFSHVASQTDVYRTIPFGRIASKLVGGFGALGVGLFFFLSGFGNWFSIAKKDKTKLAEWTIYKCLKLIIVFLIAYAFDIIIMIVSGQKFSGMDFWHGIISFSMPGTTTWYLKIQLLYYIIFSVSLWISRSSHSVFYCVIFIASILFSLPFFLLKSSWWNGFTGLCFFEGIVFANNIDKISERISRSRFKFFLAVFMFAGVYYFSLKGLGGYIAQNLTYILLVGLFAYLSSYISVISRAFLNIGKASLPIYLVHIGLVKIIFTEGTYSELSYVVFCTAVIIGSIVVHKLSNVLSKKIIRS